MTVLEFDLSPLPRRVPQQRLDRETAGAHRVREPRLDPPADEVVREVLEALRRW